MTPSTVRLGRYFDRRRERGQKGIPTFSVTIDRGLVRRDTLERRTDTNLSPEEHLRVRIGDIAYNTMRMWQGASGLAEEDALVSPAYVVLAPKETVDPRYASYLFKLPEMVHRFWAYSYGLTDDRLRLYFDDFKRIPWQLPSLPEQKKVAEILSTWDEAIEKAEKLVAATERQRRGLMQQLLSGKRRLKEHELKWQHVSLEVVFERVRRKNNNNNENVLTISGKDGLITQRDYFSKSVAAADTSGYTLLRGGEFAYNKSYSAGYPLGAIKMLPNGQTGILSSLYICFRLRDATRDDPDFYRHWFEYGGLNRELSTVAQEGARNHGLLNVGIPDFFGLRVPRPDGIEQRKIAELLTDAESAVLATYSQCEKLKSEKHALMQQLLTGKRRVPL